MKLCVFQGTFNPIHNAHLRVAEYVVNKYDFDRFLFVPAYKPPHKNCDVSIANHRLNMVKLATAYNSKFMVTDIEFKREGKSYTYLTICELYKQYIIDGKIHFIIGTDAFDFIESWYEADKLKEIVKFIVFVRDDNFEISKYDYLREKGYDFEFQSLPFQNVSSTEIRDKIKNNQSIDDYVSKEVKDYIYKNELYED